MITRYGGNGAKKSSTCCLYTGRVLPLQFNHLRPAMPLIAPSSYHAPGFLPNGHLQTIVPSLFRKVKVPYIRERVETSDHDFLDLDWALARVNRSEERITSGLVILSHGLEGDSSRPYLAGMVRHLRANGFDCLAWNYRSCSGEMNQQPRFYHIGETGDLHLVIQHALAKGYTAIQLVGFSAGGNITLKYLGEQHKDLNPAIQRAVTFSVPLDVMSSSYRLEAWDSLVYNYRFQRSLKAKVRQKMTLLPAAIRDSQWETTRTLRQFDHVLTGPLHGFPTVDAYYAQNSSLPFVPKITIPTLVINAKNDPFLSPECFPAVLARELPNVYMEFPEQGGHCGFPARNLQGTYWSEERTAEFLTHTK